MNWETPNVSRETYDRVASMLEPFFTTAGFSMKPEPARWSGGTRHIGLVPASVARDILTAWPALAEDRQNYSPTMAEMVGIAEPNGFVSGYLVAWDRDDRRVTFDTIHLAPEHRALLEALQPDELQVLGEGLRAWWD